ncbi:hypothetical protein LTR43_002495 [Exophiala xenobiotica]
MAPKQPVTSDKGLKSPLFSQAIIHNGTVYCSGSVGINPSTNKIVEGSVADRTKQVFENIKNVLEEAGSSLQNIVKMNIYLVDMADYAAMNKVCAWHLPLSQSNHIPVTDPNKFSTPFQTPSQPEPVFASRNYLARPMTPIRISLILLTIIRLTTALPKMDEPIGRRLRPRNKPGNQTETADTNPQTPANGTGNTQPTPGGKSTSRRAPRKTPARGAKQSGASGNPTDTPKPKSTKTPRKTATKRRKTPAKSTSKDAPFKPEANEPSDEEVEIPTTKSKSKTPPRKTPTKTRKTPAKASTKNVKFSPDTVDPSDDEPATQEESQEDSQEETKEPTRPTPAQSTTGVKKPRITLRVTKPASPRQKQAGGPSTGATSPGTRSAGPSARSPSSSHSSSSSDSSEPSRSSAHHSSEAPAPSGASGKSPANSSHASSKSPKRPAPEDSEPPSPKRHRSQGPSISPLTPATAAPSGPQPDSPDGLTIADAERLLDQISRVPRKLELDEISALVVCLQEKCMRFSEKHFDFHLTDEEREAWPMHLLATKYDSLFRITRYLVDANHCGWRNFLTTPEHRVPFVHGILGEWFKQRIFKIPGFGLRRDKINQLAEIDRDYLHYDAIVRNKMRAKCIEELKFDKVEKCLQDSRSSSSSDSSMDSGDQTSDYFPKEYANDINMAATDLAAQMMGQLEPLLPPPVFEPLDPDGLAQTKEEQDRSWVVRQAIQTDLVDLIHLVAGLSLSIRLAGIDGVILRLVPHVAKGSEYHIEDSCDNICVNADDCNANRPREPATLRIYMTCWGRLEAIVPHGKDRLELETFQRDHQDPGHPERFTWEQYEDRVFPVLPFDLQQTPAGRAAVANDQPIPGTEWSLNLAKAAADERHDHWYSDSSGDEADADDDDNQLPRRPPGPARGCFVTVYPKVAPTNVYCAWSPNKSATAAAAATQFPDLGSTHSDQPGHNQAEQISLAEVVQEAWRLEGGGGFPITLPALYRDTINVVLKYRLNEWLLAVPLAGGLLAAAVVVADRHGLLPHVDIARLREVLQTTTSSASISMKHVRDTLGCTLADAERYVAALLEQVRSSTQRAASGVRDLAANMTMPQMQLMSGMSSLLPLAGAPAVVISTITQRIGTTVTSVPGPIVTETIPGPIETVTVTMPPPPPSSIPIVTETLPGPIEIVTITLPEEARPRHDPDDYDYDTMEDVVYTATEEQPVYTHTEKQPVYTATEEQPVYLYAGHPAYDEEYDILNEDPYAPVVSEPFNFDSYDDMVEGQTDELAPANPGPTRTAPPVMTTRAPAARTWEGQREVGVEPDETAARDIVRDTDEEQKQQQQHQQQKRQTEQERKEYKRRERDEFHAKKNKEREGKTGWARLW